MPINAVKALAGTALTATVGGAAYLTFAILRVRAFRKNASAATGASDPPVAVLKPLHGLERGLYVNLCSFCEQDYPRYQVIFSAADPDDPALDVAREVQRRFPDRDIEVVAGAAARTRNPKVGNLLGAMERARYPLLVIADSDIRVGRGYLQAIAACFEDERTGAATCLYGGMPALSLASQLGAMFVNDQFSPSVTVATAIEPLTYCFGATMAVRRDVLARIGGLEALAEHLGDDYQLGKLVTGAGYRVALCPYVVQTTITDDRVEALWRHELRWARTIRAQRPAGYAGSILTFGLPLSFLFAASCANALVAASAVSLLAALRTWLHFEARKTFAPQVRAAPWLIPARDFFSVAVWFASFFGRRVVWRDEQFSVRTDGRMTAERPEM